MPDRSQIRAEAERCAESLPVGMFGIDDVFVAIQVIELGFRLWQACSGSSDAAGVSSVAKAAEGDSVHFKLARRRVRKAARRQGLELSTANLDGLTARMLTHVSLADPVSVGMCCQEPLIQDDDNE